MCCELIGSQQASLVLLQPGTEDNKQGQCWGSQSCPWSGSSRIQGLILSQILASGALRGQTLRQSARDLAAKVGSRNSAHQAEGGRAGAWAWVSVVFSKAFEKKEKLRWEHSLVET